MGCLGPLQPKTHSSSLPCSGSCHMLCMHLAEPNLFAAAEATPFFPEANPGADQQQLCQQPKEATQHKACLEGTHNGFHSNLTSLLPRSQMQMIWRGIIIFQPLAVKSAL